jgi:hypothetical protein
MAEQTEKEIEEGFEIDGRKEKFSFMPGSSQKTLTKYHAARRKEIDVTPSPPAVPPRIGNWRIILADKVTKERCHRSIQAGGTYRKPYINLPEEWILWWYSNFRDKKDIAPLVDLEFSADKTTIIIRKRPPAEGMQKSIYDDDDDDERVPKIFAADSDAAQELFEQENQEK